MTAPGWYDDPADGRLVRWWDGRQWTSHTRANQAATVPEVSGFSMAPAPDVAPPRPSPRLIRSPTDAEEVAAEWMRWFGYRDARVTRAGADGGIDVDSTFAVAQVKAHMTPIGRPTLQQLHGVAASVGKSAVFFSLMSYTPEAMRWADEVGMTLFRFDHAGEPEAVNEVARRLVANRHAHGEVGTRHLVAMARAASEPMIAAFSATGRHDSFYLDAAQAGRQGRLSKEDLLWVVKTWTPLLAIRCDYTTRQRKRLTASSGTSLFDTVGGLLQRPPGEATLDTVPRSTPCLTGPKKAAPIIKEMEKEHAAWHRVKTLEAQRRHADKLIALGAPAGAVSLTLSEIDGPMLPVVIAYYRSKTGDRAQVWDAAGGLASPSLSRAFTQNLPLVVEQAFSKGERLA